MPLIDRNVGLAIIRHFLPRKARKLFKIEQKDFQLISLIKEPDAYVFTRETNHFQKLRREVITSHVNKVMRSVSNQLPDQPNVTSHSFRIGYITQLWKDSKDIEFVKQTDWSSKIGYYFRLC